MANNIKCNDIVLKLRQTYTPKELSEIIKNVCEKNGWEYKEVKEEKVFYDENKPLDG